jgi:hypothetical protein
MTEFSPFWQAYWFLGLTKRVHAIIKILKGELLFSSFTVTAYMFS